MATLENTTWAPGPLYVLDEEGHNDMGDGETVTRFVLTDSEVSYDVYVDTEFAHRFLRDIQDVGDTEPKVETEGRRAFELPVYPPEANDWDWDDERFATIPRPAVCNYMGVRGDGGVFKVWVTTAPFEGTWVPLDAEFEVTTS